MESKLSTSSDVYKRSGVNIDSNNQVVDLIRSAVKSTHTPQVLTETGLFGGAYSIDEPTVLVASADSVGTKLRLSSLLGRNATIGVDLVNHCVNDILTCGARPLFFLDYFASSHVDPQLVAEVVQGLARACGEAGCALLGGETAELPGMYIPGEFDVAGFIVGSVERAKMIDGRGIRPGDVLLGLRSSGLHTNGFSLVQHILTEAGTREVDVESLTLPWSGYDGSLADALLEPHMLYLNLVTPLLERNLVKGMAHITGGGLLDNVPRMLPDGTGVWIDRSTWEPQPVFGWLQERGGVDTMEMFRVFNMGVGLVLVVAPESVSEALELLPEAWEMGKVREGEGVHLYGGVGA